MTSSTLSELAELLDAVLIGDGDLVVRGAAPLVEATSEDLSFLADLRYRGDLESTRALAVVVGPEVAEELQESALALLVCPDPGQAFSRAVEAFAQVAPPVPVGVHPTAVVDGSARLAAGVCIAPHCVVGPGAELGEGVVLHPNVTLGAGVRVGAGSVIHPGAVLYPHIRIGARCVIHANAVLGSDGLGFVRREDGWEKVPQGGTVEVGDDVEIGAATTVDRARTGATRIGSGTKIDNLVHLAHNVKVGEHGMIAAQVGIAGSTRVGARVIMGGQVGITGHVQLGDDVTVAGRSGVTQSIESGEKVAGFPAWPIQDELRSIAYMRRVGGLLKTVRKLERRIEELEGGAS